MLTWVEIRQRKRNTVWSHMWDLKKIGEFFKSFVIAQGSRFPPLGGPWTLSLPPVPLEVYEYQSSTSPLSKGKSFQGKSCLLCFTYHRGLPVLLSFWPLSAKLPTYWCIWNICRFLPSSFSVYRDRFQVITAGNSSLGWQLLNWYTHIIALLIKHSEFSSRFSMSYIPDESE